MDERYFVEVEQMEQFMLDPAFKAEFEAWLDGVNRKAQNKGEQHGISSEESGK